MDIDEAFNAALDRRAAQMNEPELKKWRAMTKEVGLKIDSETADVRCCYVQIGDAYGVHPELSDETSELTKEYFARCPETGVWVTFADLPRATAQRLWQRIEAGDFDERSAQQESKVFEGLTVEEAAEICVLAIAHFEMECFVRFPDGRWQIVIREHRGGNLAKPLQLSNGRALELLTGGRQFAKSTP